MLMSKQGFNGSAFERTPNKEVVLVVEDEFLVRLHAVHLVEQAGFEAVEAASADEAISILEAQRIFVSSSPMFICPARWMVLN